MDTERDRPRWRATGTWRTHPKLQFGLEWNPAAGEVGPLATLFLATETPRRPAVLVGTSSDRIGSPAGTTAVFLTAAKRLGPLSVAPYAGLNWSSWDEAFNLPCGAHVELGGGVGLQPMYDGNAGTCSRCGAAATSA